MLDKSSSTKLSAFYSLTIKTFFNAPSFFTSTSFNSSSFCQILFTLQTKLEVEKGAVEELHALNSRNASECKDISRNTSDKRKSRVLEMH